MPDTVLPPEDAPSTAKEAARIGTSNDKSWAGWAISSFTNKITTAEGEIQPTANGNKPAEPSTARPASVPRPVKSPPSTQSHLQKELRPKPPLGRSVSEQPAPVTKEEADEADDVIDAWDAIEDDNGWDQENEEDPFSAASPRPSSSISSTPKPNPVPFDDGGEPDFAGWLAAQSMAKSKKPLPKGLNKSNSTSRAAAAKPKAPAAPAKKIDTKPKEEVDEDWGAW